MRDGFNVSIYQWKPNKTWVLLHVLPVSMYVVFIQYESNSGHLLWSVRKRLPLKTDWIVNQAKSFQVALWYGFVVKTKRIKLYKRMHIAKIECLTKEAKKKWASEQCNRCLNDSNEHIQTQYDKQRSAHAHTRTWEQTKKTETVPPINIHYLKKLLIFRFSFIATPSSLTINQQFDCNILFYVISHFLFIQFSISNTNWCYLASQSCPVCLCACLWVVFFTQPNRRWFNSSEWAQNPTSILNDMIRSMYARNPYLSDHHSTWILSK